MSVARNNSVPDKFDIDGEFFHLADKITSDEITKRTLKNGLLKFLRDKHPNDFVKKGSDKNF